MTSSSFRKSGGRVTRAPPSMTEGRHHYSHPKIKLQPEILSSSHPSSHHPLMTQSVTCPLPIRVSGTTVQIEFLIRENDVAGFAWSVRGSVCMVRLARIGRRHNNNNMIIHSPTTTAEIERRQKDGFKSGLIP